MSNSKLLFLDWNWNYKIDNTILLTLDQEKIFKV